MLRPPAAMDLYALPGDRLRIHHTFRPDRDAWANAGLRAVEDARERYRFRITSRADAELVLSGLYLPNTPRVRVERAVDYLVESLDRLPSVEIAIPMRRLVAIK